MTAPPCDRPGCRGTLTSTGFCSACFREPLGARARRPAAGARRASGAGTPPPGTAAQRNEPVADGGLDRDGLVPLPSITVPPPAEVAGSTATLPSGGRTCGLGGCVGLIGIDFETGRACESGYCTDCGRKYSFVPQLSPGDELEGQYRVLGYLTTGGLGWVYLAEDLRLDGQYVVLKEVINPDDPASRKNAEEERHRLTTLRHRDIVRIVTSVRHERDDGGEPTDYIVMEYVAGRTLKSLLDDRAELERLYGGAFTLDHVVTYGCKILGALEYLHEQGLLYCDMKPDNVIHYGREIKVVDVGGVRRVDDHVSRLTYHPDFAPPKAERDSRGFHVDSDLYTVGRTLARLAAAAVPATGLVSRSFGHLISRATHVDPAARFASAAEMSRQLWEVLREHRALTRHETYPEQSTRFEPTARLFGPALATVPELGNWTRRPPGEPPGLDVGAPQAGDAARGLPEPLPDPADPAATQLRRLAAGRPDEIALRAGDEHPVLGTPEAALWICRAYLRAGDADLADAWLRKAEARIGGDASRYDWRLSWHEGVLALTREHVEEAKGHFLAVYASLPGEWAPKLALGYCQEHLANSGGRSEAMAGEPDDEAYYEAVWQRDRTQGSAALGLARAHLRRGDKQSALDVLDLVPDTTRHYPEARVAAVRLLAGRLAGCATTARDLAEAATRLDTLPVDSHEARQRLTAEVLEAAAYACRHGEVQAAPHHPHFGTSGGARELDERLHRALHDLADQARDGAEREELLDRSYAVRPMSRF